MNPLVEQTPDTLRLIREYRATCREFCQLPNLSWQPLQYEFSDNLLNEGLPSDGFVQITQGRIAVFQDDKNLLFWEEEDCFFVADYQRPVTASVRPHLVVDEPVSLRFMPANTLWQSAHASALLHKLLIVQRQLLVQTISQLVMDEHRPTPGFRRYNDGDVIIREGDPAEYVYTIMDGAAEVYVNEVKVGEIAQEEIFGAIAVLCNQPRTATVKARGACNVLMVPPQEFTTLLNTHPQMFINLLRDMARNITNLNERVVHLEAR